MSGGTRSYEMARRLVARGHEVHMITSDSDQTAEYATDWRMTDESGIRVHWYPVRYDNKMSYRERIGAFRKFAWHSARRAASVRADLVFATSTPLTVALPGIYAAARCRVPFVFEVRDLWPEVPIVVGALKNRFVIGAARALEWAAYRSARRLVALSPRMKEGIVNRGIAADRVTVIPNGCDFELFDVPPQRGEDFRRQHAWLQDRPLVVYIGTLGLINGVSYFVRLASEVARLNAEVRFLVVGTGQQENMIRQQAMDAGVLDRSFFMMPQVPKCEVPGILSAADLATSLVIDRPEVAADSANKFFDALAAGTPVAINHGGWLADLIRQREIGLVMDPVDIGDAARSVAGFVTDSRRVACAGKAASKTARELFGRDELARRLESTLLAAIGQTISCQRIQALEKAA